MIPVDEYCIFLKEAEENIKNIDRRIAYRKIELIGARAQNISNPFLNCLTAGTSTQSLSVEEQRIIDNDSVLAQLMYDKQEYVNRIEYVKTRAEYPKFEK